MLQYRSCILFLPSGEASVRRVLIACSGSRVVLYSISIARCILSKFRKLDGSWMDQHLQKSSVHNSRKNFFFCVSSLCYVLGSADCSPEENQNRSPLERHCLSRFSFQQKSRRSMTVIASDNFLLNSVTELTIRETFSRNNAEKNGIERLLPLSKNEVHSGLFTRYSTAM